MNLKFQWEPDEWREALALASEGPRRPAVPFMTYAVIGVMSLGAVGEVLNAVRTADSLDYSESIMPLLLFAGAVVIATQVYTRGVRRQKAGPQVPMPTAEQQVLLTENGWRIATAQEPAEIRPWNELYEQRMGSRSLILVGNGDAFAALPLRALSDAQGSHLHRLLMRKLRGCR